LNRLKGELAELIESCDVEGEFGERVQRVWNTLNVSIHQALQNFIDEVGEGRLDEECVEVIRDIVEMMA
jgi:hypothetical protein